MSNSIADLLESIFESERTLRKNHDALASKPKKDAIAALHQAKARALEEDEDEEASLRLVRLAALYGEFEGPDVVDALIDILDAPQPEARMAAGRELEDMAFDRFKEVALGVERALDRLEEGSLALSELPYVLSDVPEPGVVSLLIRFLKHADADAVAASIECLAEIGDPRAVEPIKELANDERNVEIADESGEGGEEVTLGELANEALQLLEAIGDDRSDA